MSEIKYISQSILSLLSRCGMQAYYRLIEGRSEPPAIALIEGTAAHAGIEANLRAKIETGSLLDPAEVAQHAADGFEKAWAEKPEGPFTEDDVRDLGLDVARGRSKDRAVRMSTAHALNIAPLIEPVAVERRITLQIPGIKYDVSGQLDVQEPLRVRDSKTSAKTKGQEDVERSVQLQLYTMLVETADGVRPTEACLDVMVKPTTTGIVKTQVLTAPTPTDHAPVLMRLSAAARVLEAGAFMPVDPTGPGAWVCSERFCGFYHRCPYGARARVVIPAPGL